MVAVPKASAPIACAPPTRKMRSTPARAAAASTASLGAPSGVGVTITSRGTPATFAATAVIRTEDG
jgi:hypothetical protein